MITLGKPIVFNRLLYASIHSKRNITEIIISIFSTKTFALRFSSGIVFVRIVQSHTQCRGNAPHKWNNQQFQLNAATRLPKVESKQGTGRDKRRRNQSQKTQSCMVYIHMQPQDEKKQVQVIYRHHTQNIEFIYSNIVCSVFIHAWTEMQISVFTRNLRKPKRNRLHCNIRDTMLKYRKFIDKRVRGFVTVCVCVCVCTENLSHVVLFHDQFLRWRRDTEGRGSYTDMHRYAPFTMLPNIGSAALFVAVRFARIGSVVVYIFANGSTFQLFSGSGIGFPFVFRLFAQPYFRIYFFLSVSWIYSGCSMVQTKAHTHTHKQINTFQNQCCE